MLLVLVGDCFPALGSTVIYSCVSHILGPLENTLYCTQLLSFVVYFSTLLRHTHPCLFLSPQLLANPVMRL